MDDILLRTSSALQWYVLFVQQRQGIHEINEMRGTYGEYHHLFRQLREDPVRFQRYTRMSPETFDYVLNKIRQQLEKNWSNFIRTPILPEEQLVITMR
jgi:hypothetical protein